MNCHLRHSYRAHFLLCFLIDYSYKLLPKSKTKLCCRAISACGLACMHIMQSISHYFMQTGISAVYIASMACSDSYEFL